MLTNNKSLLLFQQGEDIIRLIPMSMQHASTFACATSKKTGICSNRFCSKKSTFCCCKLANKVLGSIVKNLSLWRSVCCRGIWGFWAVSSDALIFYCGLRRSNTLMTGTRAWQGEKKKGQIHLFKSLWQRLHHSNPAKTASPLKSPAQ